MNITAKLRIAKLEDLFYGDMTSCKKAQWVKPNIVHFILNENEVSGVLKTPDEPNCRSTFQEYLLLIFEKRVLIPDNIYCNSHFQKEVLLVPAKINDLKRFSSYFNIIGDDIRGPFQLMEDFIYLDNNYYPNRLLINEFKNNRLFVIVNNK